jgi:hypothetical protein
VFEGSGEELVAAGGGVSVAPVVQGGRGVEGCYCVPVGDMLRLAAGGLLPAGEDVGGGVRAERDGYLFAQLGQVYAGGAYAGGLPVDECCDVAVVPDEVAGPDVTMQIDRVLRR